MPAPTLLDAQLRSHVFEEVERARARIFAELVAERGSIPKTAARLGVSRRTLSRLLVRAGLAATAADLRKQGQADGSIEDPTPKAL